MAKTRVLYVLHNHPTLFPGGAEQYALELFEALRGSDEIEPLLLARITRTHMPQGNLRLTPFSTVDGEPDQYFLFTESEPTFDYFLGTSRDKSLVHDPPPGLPCHLQAGRCPFPAHGPHRLRRDLDRATSAPRGADPLHAARVPPDLSSPRADAAHAGQARGAVHEGVAATLQRVLSDDSEQRVLPAGALRQGASRQGRSLPRPERISSTALRRLGHPSGSHRLRGLRSPAGDQAGRVGRRPATQTASATSASSMPTRASRRCSRQWRPSASDRTSSCDCTEPTSTTSRPSSRTALRRNSSAQNATSG